MRSPQAISAEPAANKNPARDRMRRAGFVDPVTEAAAYFRWSIWM
jgi:hypothetical protein